MKVVYFKKRRLVILIAVMITFAIFYMTFILHSLPIQENEPFAVNVIFKLSISVNSNY
jgi:hypothetical protein